MYNFSFSNSTIIESSRVDYIKMDLRFMDEVFSCKILRKIVNE